MTEQKDLNKARLEGWRDAILWIKKEFFDHDHQMAMGEFKHAAVSMLDAKLTWINSHEYFADDSHESLAKIPK